MKGGRTSKTWKKGEKPPVQRPKGSKNRSTKIKEYLGLKGWDGLKQYIETDGATRLIYEINKLKGKDYTTAINMFSEYIKPKLARSELTGKDGEKLNITLKIIRGKGNLPDAS